MDPCCKVNLKSSMLASDVSSQDFTILSPCAACAISTKTFSLQACNVDKECNLDLFIDEILHEYEKDGTEPYYMIELAAGFPARKT